MGLANGKVEGGGVIMIVEDNMSVCSRQVYWGSEIKTVQYNIMAHNY